ncbi:hypothetical protein QBK99_24325 [Corticibacterium sp. UT-5YL-CI-8]|nr:hypothetical protein [Tianweitania sp. UT-5YL-CI-8]
MTSAWTTARRWTGYGGVGVHAGCAADAFAPERHLHRSDVEAFRRLGHAHDLLGLDIEPPAAPAFSGPTWVTETRATRVYLSRHGIDGKLAWATHGIWTTGGSLVPEHERERFLARIAALQSSGA